MSVLDNFHSSASRRTLRMFAIGLIAIVYILAMVWEARAQTLTKNNSDADESTRIVVVASEQTFDSTANPISDPAAILRSAKTIYIRKKSVYFKAQELENELRKRPEFQRWGLAITRNEFGADLIIEVGRKVFTTRFVYSVIHPRTDIIVLSGKLSSVGGTLSTKIAKRFIEQMESVGSRQ